MSKNTSSNKFRKVNVDAFDEENFIDDVLVAEVDLAGEVAAREAECRRLAGAGKKVEALRAALASPPYAAADDVKVGCAVILTRPSSMGMVLHLD